MTRQIPSSLARAVCLGRPDDPGAAVRQLATLLASNPLAGPLIGGGGIPVRLAQAELGRGDGRCPDCIYGTSSLLHQGAPWRRIQPCSRHRRTRDARRVGR